MNWKRWFKFDPYKKLWSLIGQRPWTFIYRDIWHTYEYFPQAQWFFTGVAIYWLAEHWLAIPWKEAVLIFWAVYTYGYINGHFFWGTRYIEGEKGD